MALKLIFNMDRIICYRPQQCNDALHVLQDNVIFERLNETSQYKDLTLAHLEQFATEGEEFLQPVIV